MMKRKTIFKHAVGVLVTLCCLVAQGTWAQGQFGNLPATVDASEVEVTEVGYIQFLSHDSLVVNPATGLIDTLHIDAGQF